MSKTELTGKGNALLVVLEDYINTATAIAVAEALAGAKAPDKKATKKAAAPAADKKADKKELAEKQAEAKHIAGKVMAELGKAVLGDLLGDIPAKKFSDIKTLDGFNSFIVTATAALEVKPGDQDDDDLLGDSPEPAAEKTLDDVKDILLQVNNNDQLGRDVTKEILGELGVRRLPELKAEKYGDAYAAAEKALNNVG